jgi:hypothetical protein
MRSWHSMLNVVSSQLYSKQVCGALALGVPGAITMAGGYAKRVEDTADIHFQTVKLAAELL